MNAKSIPTSPLTPQSMPELPPIAGCQMAAVKAGIKQMRREDLLLMSFVEGTTAAGVFTQSATAAAPVLRSRQHVASGLARGVLVNSGNANAFTGQLGEMAVNQTLARTSQLLGCEPEEILVASTGVIGEPLPYERILAALPDAVNALSHGGWNTASEAIRTTDTFAKRATRQVEIGGKTLTLNGIAKGSGMIAPNMATMLGFIATDAAIDSELLHEVLIEANATSFNAISVDGDCSTNDCVMLFATGQSGLTIDKGEALEAFKTALHSLMLELAQLIIRDGEGATKFITIRAKGAPSEADARNLAMTIANSPLVKTAIAGEDANWGRIVMAAGNSGIRFDPKQLHIAFGPHIVTQAGQRHPNYDEATLSAYMKSAEIDLTVNLNAGDAHFTAYSCDLTKGYIAINADYRS